MKLISVTMKLFFWEKFHCDLKGWKTCKFKSLRFDFCVINFDTMKFILIAKVLKILVPSHFWQKKKRNASIVSILAFQYGGGEGSWTPVRKHFNRIFSGRRRLLAGSCSPCSHPGGKPSRRPVQVRVMMRGQVNSFPPHGRHINDAFPGLWPLRFRRLP